VSKRVLYAAVAALALSATSGEALAQGPWMGALPPYEIATIVRSTGLSPLERPFRRGPTYVVHAIDQRGDEMRVVLDARHGDILSVTPISTISRLGPAPGGYPYGPPPRVGGGAPPLPEYMDSPPPSGYEPDRQRYGSRLPPPDRSPGANPPDVIYATPPADMARRNRPPEYYGGRSADPYGEPSQERLYGARPVERGPMGPPPGDGSRYNEPPAMVRGMPPGERQANIAPDRDTGGLLPPPPERFQRRPAPPEQAAKPAPKRAAAAPTAPPLPKSRPAAASAEPAKAGSQPAAASTSAPAASPPAPVQKRADDGIAH